MTKEEFKEIRQALKLRGHELAKKLGKPISEVYAYETGIKNIPDDIEKYLRIINPKK
jgi:DNA-binding transcriptional regulator YiaG